MALPIQSAVRLPYMAATVLQWVTLKAIGFFAPRNHATSFFAFLLFCPVSSPTFTRSNTTVVSPSSSHAPAYSLSKNVLQSSLTMHLDFLGDRPGRFLSSVEIHDVYWIASVIVMLVRVLPGREFSLFGLVRFAIFRLHMIEPYNERHGSRSSCQ